MQFSKYRQVDLTILLGLAVIAEFLGYWLHLELTGAGYYLNLSMLVCLITVFRWGPIGIAIYPIVGLVEVILAEPGMLGQQLLLYPVANLFILLVLGVFKLIPRKHLLSNPLLMVVLSLSAYVSVALGKGLAAFIINGAFIENAVMYLVGETFSVIVVTTLLVFLRKREGLLSDMKEYFLNFNEGEVNQ